MAKGRRVAFRAAHTCKGATGPRAERPNSSTDSDDHRAQARRLPAGIAETYRCAKRGIDRSRVTDYVTR